MLMYIWFAVMMQAFIPGGDRIARLPSMSPSSPAATASGSAGLGIFPICTTDASNRFVSAAHRCAMIRRSSHPYIGIFPSAALSSQ